MFKQIVAALFGTRATRVPEATPSVHQTVRGIPVIEATDQEKQERTAGTERGLAASTLFKPEKRNILLDHLHGKRNLHKEEPFLTVEEKRSLGLNTRGRFSKVFVDCLTPEGLAHEDPKDALDVIRIVALHRAARAESLRGLRRAGITRVEILNCGDERDCDWVRRKKNRVHPVGTDVESLITTNCDAEYCRCALVMRDKA